MGAAPAGVVWLTNDLLSRSWGDAELSYGGWGSAHLQARARTWEGVAPFGVAARVLSDDAYAHATVAAGHNNPSGARLDRGERRV